MSGSTFRLEIGVPRRVTVQGRPLSREDFYEWVWQEFRTAGIVGVHEGTVLSADASAQGLETESWTLDAAEAPRERDWISDQGVIRTEIYFSSLDGAKAAQSKLSKLSDVQVGQICEEKPQDWDAQWKASFLGAKDGVKVAPFWRILPPWVSAAEAGLSPKERALKINPGAGFGTGTHETTQLCLSAIGESFGGDLKGRRALDFGSGSGILAIGAALLGAEVDAVEVDPLALDNAAENAKLNGVEGRIASSLSLEEARDAARGPYDLVIANILRPVLVAFSEPLAKRLGSSGVLILSGLIESDVAQVSACYSKLLGFEPVRTSLGEWRALIWKRGGP